MYNIDWTKYPDSDADAHIVEADRVTPVYSKEHLIKAFGEVPSSYAEVVPGYYACFED